MKRARPALPQALKDLKRLSRQYIDECESTLSKVQEWDRRAEQWKDLDRQIDGDIAASANLVTLNVGGKLFTTTKSTLLRMEGSTFHDLLAQDKWNGKETLFLDVDGSTFDRVLGYLRSNELYLVGLTEWGLHQLRHTLSRLRISLPQPTPLKTPARTMRAARLTVEEPTFISARVSVSSTNSPTTSPAVDGMTMSPPPFAKQPQLLWAEKSKAKLSHDKLTITTADCNKTVCLNDAAGDVVVGFASMEDMANEDEQFELLIDLKNGWLSNAPGEKLHEYDTKGPFINGDILTVRRTGNHIHFERNEHKLGPAFEINIAVELVPVAFIKGQAQLTILE
ncbi:hypothetical protein AC1031_004754 [Aphanomyces cochlioides]|nr:hypothetical protein AC1031_004754 [Aphanomyces cochlioides]